jgi:omega-6 fatty acid desaturase (delta-12 desaturase)
MSLDWQRRLFLSFMILVVLANFLFEERNALKRPEWFDKLSPYAAPHYLHSIIFLLTSILPYLFLVSFMLYLRLKGFPYWVVLLLAVPASGFYIRTFIVLHDCAHLSFSGSKKICSILGHLCGLLTLTPFWDWKRNHGHHHINVGNLDKRGMDDIWTMTFEEYRAANLLNRLLYRVSNNPAIRTISFWSCRKSP